jgi:hypothetical protein
MRDKGEDNRVPSDAQEKRESKRLPIGGPH